MIFGNYRYIADDGITYQVALHIDRTGPLAGNLPAASGSEPIFPALYTPRGMFARNITNDGLPPIVVVCDATNTAYIQGQGAILSVGSDTYEVVSANGESKPVGS